MEGFTEYKRKRYPYHYYSPIWESMRMAKDVEDAFKAGMAAAAKRCAEIAVHHSYRNFDDGYTDASRNIESEIRQEFK